MSSRTNTKRHLRELTKRQEPIFPSLHARFLVLLPLPFDLADDSVEISHDRRAQRHLRYPEFHPPPPPRPDSGIGVDNHCSEAVGAALRLELDGFGAIGRNRFPFLLDEVNLVRGFVANTLG